MSSPSGTGRWQAVYHRTDSVVTREIAGETILVPVVGELAHLQEIFALDEVAAFIWQGLDGRQTLGEILQGVVDEFEVSQSQAEKDLLTFLDQLREATLVHPAGNSDNSGSDNSGSDNSGSDNSGSDNGDSDNGHKDTSNRDRG